jgi:hypothetical protein
MEVVIENMMTPENKDLELANDGIEDRERLSSQSFDEIKSFPTPRLDALEKLYVRTYLHTLSHPRAHEAISPGLAKYRIDNPYSRRENVQYHINLAIQEKTEALQIDPQKIIERLYHEALREGAGSNHSARIQALQLLGKQLGMFEEKEKGDVYHINVVNYSPIETLEVEGTPESNVETELLVEDKTISNIKDEEAIFSSFDNSPIDFIIEEYSSSNINQEINNDSD